VDFETVRLTELKAFQESHQSLNVSHSSSSKALSKQGSLSQQNLAQQTWQRERQLLLEEIDLLLSQVDVFQRNYLQVMEVRQRETQLLTQERQVLAQAGDSMADFIDSQKQLSQMLDDCSRRKSEFLVLSEEAAVKDLLKELETQRELLQEERRVAEAELHQVTAVFESKLIQVQEREASKDFELSKLHKELELAQAEGRAWLQRNQQFQASQQREIERLRKFLNERQTEIST